MGLSPKRQEELRRNAEAANKERDEQAVSQQKQSKSKRNLAIGGVAVVLVAVLAYAVFAMTQPGYYDDFAKCLSEKGAVMYGATFCQYSKAQIGMFGKSFKHVNYKDFTKAENIKVTPTWIIDGERYENVQSFERLSALTGCSLI